MSLSPAALNLFLSLLPEHRVTRGKTRIIVHANAGDAVWFARDGRWITAAPEFEAAVRSGPRGTVH